MSRIESLASNKYPGRGIIIGKSSDGENAAIAYFIMGRSENSRNRVFVEDGDGLRTQAKDPSKCSDPSLIIYSPVRVLGDNTIVTNGDQTDTVYEYIASGSTFEEALRTREFEPDEPNYTPRISGIVSCKNDDFSYKLSILKSADGNPDLCERFFYEYAKPICGKGHLIHTYDCDGNPIPSFSKEPTAIEIPNSIDDFTVNVWTSLNDDNKISLFVRYINLKTKEIKTNVINK